MVTTAIDCIISAPIPTPIAIVDKPSIVVNELASLPGSEYGYINSTLENISVDAKVSQKEGTSYYTATCSIDETTLKNKKGESIDIKNGMLAQVRVVNRKVSYLRYFLEKIDILD